MTTPSDFCNHRWPEWNTLARSYVKLVYELLSLSGERSKLSLARESLYARRELWFCLVQNDGTLQNEDEIVMCTGTAAIELNSGH